METQITSNREVRSKMLSEGDMSNLLIFSSDRTIPTNFVCLDVLQNVLIEFSEVNVSSKNPIIKCNKMNIPLKWACTYLVEYKKWRAGFHSGFCKRRANVLDKGEKVLRSYINDSQRGQTITEGGLHANQVRANIRLVNTGRQGIGWTGGGHDVEKDQFQR